MKLIFTLIGSAIAAWLLLIFYMVFFVDVTTNEDLEEEYTTHVLIPCAELGISETEFAIGSDMGMDRNEFVRSVATIMGAGLDRDVIFPFLMEHTADERVGLYNGALQQLTSQGACE